jgi:signal transduction histidine kinase
VRLAGLTAVMLAILLLALGLFVYFTMRDALLQPARAAAQSRAVAAREHLIELERASATREVPDASSELEQGGVFVSFANSNLQLLGHSVTPFGAALPAPTEARAVLASLRPTFTTRSVAGQDYLIYSEPVVQHGQIVGVVQTGISEHQYEAGLQSLIAILALVAAFGLVAIVGITAVVVRRALLPVRASMQRQREFVADAAHELRTPLTIICTAAELGLTSDSSNEQQEALEHALAQGRHLKRLVDDLSLLARTDSGTLDLRHEMVDLSKLVSRTADDLEVLAEDRGVRFTRNLQVPAYVLGDPDRLRQLLVILLDNALKHSPDGGEVNIALIRRGGQAELRIEDSGPGIAPTDLPHIFDRFYRADRARSREEGTGLGLAIARWIVEAHGAEISASNSPHGGAIFAVAFAIAPRSSIDQPSPASA